MVSLIDLQPVKSIIENTRSNTETLICDDINKNPPFDFGTEGFVLRVIFAFLSVPSFEHIGKLVYDIARQHSCFGKSVTGEVCRFAVDENSCRSCIGRSKSLRRECADDARENITAAALGKTRVACFADEKLSAACDIGGNALCGNDNIKLARKLYSHCEPVGVVGVESGGVKAFQLAVMRSEDKPALCVSDNIYAGTYAVYAVSINNYGTIGIFDDSSDDLFGVLGMGQAASNGNGGGIFQLIYKNSSRFCRNRAVLCGIEREERCFKNERSKSVGDFVR